MWEEDVGCLPVVDPEGRLIGMVTDRDACMAAYTQGRPLSAISVYSAMAHHVHSRAEKTRIEDVEKIMKENRVRRVPVVDDQDHLVGLISMNDIARESALELDKKKPQVTAGGVVSTLASICRPRRSISQAAQ